MAKAPISEEATIDPGIKIDRPICGIVRPIADIDGYPAGHWSEVHDILCDAIEVAGYQARLVSENESVGVILGNIVSNLYADPIVVCDVSAKNPNVLFELGMRVAFEKPTIIITDDITPFSFDISPIKHIVYPSSLRFAGINKLKLDLTSAIHATVVQSQDSKYRGYLQQFGPIKVAELGTQIVTAEQIVGDLQDIRRSIRALESRSASDRSVTSDVNPPPAHIVNIQGINEFYLDDLINDLKKLKTVSEVRRLTTGKNIFLRIRPNNIGGFNREDVRREANPVILKYKNRSIMSE